MLQKFWVLVCLFERKKQHEIQNPSKAFKSLKKLCFFLTKFNIKIIIILDQASQIWHYFCHEERKKILTSNIKLQCHELL